MFNTVFTKTLNALLLRRKKYIPNLASYLLKIYFNIILPSISRSSNLPTEDKFIFTFQYFLIFSERVSWKFSKDCHVSVLSSVRHKTTNTYSYLKKTQRWFMDSPFWSIQNLSQILNQMHHFHKIRYQHKAQEVVPNSLNSNFPQPSLKQVGRANK
jgi:hypothetical protein